MLGKPKLLISPSDLEKLMRSLKERNANVLGAKIALRAIAGGDLSLDAAKRLAAEALAKFPKD